MPLIDTTALVPGFYDPGSPPPLNPHTVEAEDIAIDWMRRIGFITSDQQEAHLRSFKFGSYHGLITPTVDLPHQVIGMKWFCWGSLADDQYDNHTWHDPLGAMRWIMRQFRSVVTTGRPTEPTDHPVVVGLADYWPDLLAGRTGAGRRRLIRNFLNYMDGVEYQNIYRTAERTPDLTTFVGMRRHTISMHFQADVLDSVLGNAVPDPLRDHYLVREIVRCFADIEGIHNDVYGLEKDLADGQTCNTVLVVAAAEDCPPARAVDRVLARARQRQRLLLELEAELPELAAQLDLPLDAAAQAARLARDLRAYIHANLIWIRHTQRYDLDRPRIRGTFDDVLTRPRPHARREGDRSWPPNSTRFRSRPPAAR